MPIWFKDYTLEEVNRRGRDNMAGHLGIEIIEIGDDSLTGRMPVDHRTKQPLGLLHGGASVALAETLGSTAGSMVIDLAKNFCVGLEINANHLKGCREGFVLGTARPIHLGRSTQVWETRIVQEDRLVCVSRLTLSILKR
jgi:1,4-dihydroxy-2-naphthoyl-CoA hydrolase